MPETTHDIEARAARNQGRSIDRPRDGRRFRAHRPARALLRAASPDDSVRRARASESNERNVRLRRGARLRRGLAGPNSRLAWSPGDDDPRESRRALRRLRPRSFGGKSRASQKAGSRAARACGPGDRWRCRPLRHSRSRRHVRFAESYPRPCLRLPAGNARIETWRFAKRGDDAPARCGRKGARRPGVRNSRRLQIRWAAPA